MSTDMSMGMQQYSAIAEGITGIFQSYQGAEDSEEFAKKIKEHWKDRPVYSIPGSVEEATALLKAQSQQGLPGQDLIEGQIQQDTAQGVAASRESATSAADLMGATTQMYSSQTQALTDLQVQSARQKVANTTAYTNMLKDKAAYEEQAFIYNEAQPWDIQMVELQKKLQGSMDLVTEGQATITDSYANFAG